MDRTKEGPLEFIGVGLYTIPEAARILQVNVRTLRGWVEGYTYDTKLRQVQQRPVVHRRLKLDKPVLTFYELIELLFVKLFRKEGVSMQTIRKASIAASKLFETPYPFAVKRFDTDGKRVFATLEAEARSRKEARLVEELGLGQTAFDPIVRQFFRQLDYRGEAEALRYWPEEGGRFVVLDPNRAFGQPIDAQTGVPTKSLFAAFRANGGMDVERVAGWFQIPSKNVVHAIRYEEVLLQAA